jgi:DNA-binding LacI/PurR family transcriptional regulator
VGYRRRMASRGDSHRVPEDLSIVGLDDIRFSQYVRRG